MNTRKNNISLCVEMFGVHFSELTPDEKKEYWKELYNRTRKAPQSIVNKMFGKKFKDLTEEERYMYNKVIARRRSL